MTLSCVICNDNRQKNPQCLLFPFPDPSAQPVLYQKYLTVCDLQGQPQPSDGALYICSTHFTAECIDAEGNLAEGSMPTTNLERIEIEAYADEDFQMLEEYEPLFSVKPTAEQVSVESLAPSSETPEMETETLLVPKAEPIEMISEDTSFTETEIKTEAPDVDEGIPDPFGNVTAANDQESDPKYCILCGDRESKNPNCRLYVFPKKIPKIYRKWMLAAKLDINRYQDKDIYSCQKHFPENGFFANGRFIQSWATPKLHLPSKAKSSTPKPSTSSEPQVIFLNEPGPSSSSSSTSVAGRRTGPQIVIKSNPANRKNAEALNIDPDAYAKTFAKVVMELMPLKLNYNGEQRPVTGTIVFQSNLF